VKKLYIGMDVHHKKTMYVVMDPTGEVEDRGCIDTTVEGFEGLFGKKIPAGTEVAFESGEKMYWLSKVLLELEMVPVAVNAREVRARARRPNQKSDQRDAYEICDGLRRGIYTSIVYVPSLEVRRLRQIISRRRHFVKACGMQINAAKFLLRSNGVHLSKRLVLNKAGWERLMQMDEVSNILEHLKMHKNMWEMAHGFIRALEEELAEASKPFQEVIDLLQTMPGVGPITAVSFVAALGEVKRFKSAAEVASYLGLVPSMYDSGGKQRHGHITKGGPSYVRAVLCECAHHAARKNHPLNADWRRRMVKGGYRKAVIAIAHRMANILFSMWKNMEAFDPAKLQPEKRTEQRAKVYIMKTG
jgi:transposase